jgi:hypothetical protein
VIQPTYIANNGIGGYCLEKIAYEALNIISEVAKKNGIKIDNVFSRLRKIEPTAHQNAFNIFAKTISRYTVE